MFVASPIHQILDLARWAPSGDNTQPWHFEVLNDLHFIVHGRDTRADCVYDLDGRPSQLSLGALIETIDIAASQFGLSARVSRRGEADEARPTFDIILVDQPGRRTSELVAEIPVRSVCRRPMRMQAVAEQDVKALASAVGSEYELICYSSWAERLRWAALLWRNAGLRLRLPEAFEVHRRVIEWQTNFSADRIPDRSLGASAATLLVMRQAMKNWRRVDFLNTWMGGTIGPRIEMDLIPALACGAHIALVARQVPVCVDDYVAAGRAIQRFWLKATALGLQHQPAVTPLVFSRYIREGRQFSARPEFKAMAGQISSGLASLLGDRSDRTVWLGRLGYGHRTLARSERRSLAALCQFR